MKKLLSVLLAASMMFAVTGVAAEESSPAPKKAVKKAEKKSAKKAADEVEPDIKDAIASEYNCEQGHKITVYRHANDEQNVAMLWNKKLYQMNRVNTESGAERLEQPGAGLLFIGIPAKAMLLDSKKGRQLANECKLPGQ